MNKKKIIIGAIVALIVLPIVFNKVMTFVSTKIMAKMNAKPPAVEIGTVVKQSLIYNSEPTRRRGIPYAVFCLKKKNRRKS